MECKLYACDDIDEIKDDLEILAWNIGEETRDGTTIRKALAYINYLEYNNKVKEVTKKEEPFIEKGQEYFCIDSSTFETKNYYYIDDDTDKKFLECGNIFPFTEESREEVYKEVNLIAEKRKLQSQMEQFARLNNKGKFDWSNNNQKKWYLYINYARSEIIIAWYTTHKTPNVTYFTSREVAQQALEKFGSRIKKLYLQEGEE